MKTNIKCNNCGCSLDKTDSLQVNYHKENCMLDAEVKQMYFPRVKVSHQIILKKRQYSFALKVRMGTFSWINVLINNTPLIATNFPLHSIHRPIHLN